MTLIKRIYTDIIVHELMVQLGVCLPYKHSVRNVSFGRNDDTQTRPHSLLATGEREKVLRIEAKGE